VQEFFSWAAGVLFIIAFVPYILAIAKGDAKPSKATWFIWASLDSIILYGMFAKGALNNQIIGAVTGAWAVFLLSLFYGEKGWTKLEMFCLAGAALGITLWQVFDSPTLGIITSLSVVFIGAFPTFKRAYDHPAQEDRTAWTIFWISCVCAVLAIPVWDWDNAAQPITFFVIESIMMWLLWKPRRMQVVERQSRLVLTEADAFYVDVARLSIRPDVAEFNEKVERHLSRPVSEPWPPISPGTIVRTTRPNWDKRREWTDAGWERRVWGIEGPIIMHHDSHGLCYDVRHPDGTQGCYDPSEIEIVVPANN
jgi:hypothetical protein